MIEVRCFGSLAEVASLRDEINALNLASMRPDPFSTFEFFENFLLHDEHASSHREQRLWFLCAFTAGQLIGYLPLRQTTRKALGLRTSTLSCLVTHDTDRPHAVSRPEQLTQVSEAFYAYLLGRKREWSFLEFQQQDDSSSLFPPPAAVSLKGYWVRQWPSMENGTIHIRWQTLREYFKALSQKSRSNVSRQMRSLLAAGDVAWLSSSDPAITPALFELYRGIERYSWKSRANANIGRHPERVEYVKGLLDARQPMRITIQILLLDNVPIAGIISGTFMNGLYLLHNVHDDRLSYAAPGSAMLLMAMRQAIEGGYAFVNLLSGFGYYKTRWLAEITETRIAQIYRLGRPMFWSRVIGDLKRRAERVKSTQTPVLFNATRREVGERNLVSTDRGNDPGLDTKTGSRWCSVELLADIRNGRAEFIEAAEFAGAMPFETRRDNAESTSKVSHAIPESP